MPALASTGSSGSDREFGDTGSACTPSLCEGKDSPNSDRSKWYFNAYCQRSSDGLKQSQQDEWVDTGPDRSNKSSYPSVMGWLLRVGFAASGVVACPTAARTCTFELPSSAIGSSGLNAQSCRTNRKFDVRQAEKKELKNSEEELGGFRWIRT
jgi:hypothetical protein